MKRTLSLVLVFLMAFGFIGNIPIVADAAAPTSYTNINAGDTKSVTISTSDSAKYFRFVPTQSGKYTFASSNYSGDPKGYLLDSNGVELAQNDDIVSGNYNFSITYTCYAGTTYYLKAGMYSNRTGSYDVRITMDSAIDTAPTSGAHSYYNSGTGDVFLGGNYIELGISKHGSFGTSTSPSVTGFHCGSNKLGMIVDGDGWGVGASPTTGDFFLPDTPEERYILAYNYRGTNYQYIVADRRDVFSGSWTSAPTVRNQSGGDTLKAVVTGVTTHNVKLEITYSFGVNDKFYRTDVKITNNGSYDITNVRFVRSFDPDQDDDIYDTNNTYNKVICNPSASAPASDTNYAMVVARGAQTLEGFFFIAFDNRARASQGVSFAPDSAYLTGLWPETHSFSNYATDAAIAMTKSNTNGYTIDDTGIAITFNFGSITVGGVDNGQYYSSMSPTIEDSLQEILEPVAPVIQTISGATLPHGYTSGGPSVAVSLADNHVATYQWYKNTTNSNVGGTLISGATSPSYAVPLKHRTNTTEYYYCVVTATRTDNGLSATTKSAAVSVFYQDGSHNWTETGRDEPTCDTEGTIYYTCNDCPATKSEKIPATTHSSSDWIIDQNPTCTEPGSKHTECTECGKTLQEEMIPAPGHDYVYTRTQEPTCTAEGYDLYTCNRSGCGSTKKQVIDKLPHDYGDDNVCDNCGHTIPVAHTHSYISVIVPPTCSTMGYTEHTCDCGHSYRDDYIENLSHNWIETVTREKTCTTDGLKTYTCINCTATFTEIIPAGHNWQDTVTQPATCTTDGQISRTCLDCGATEVETIPAGHTWKAGAQIQAPTCTEAGLMCHTCIACGHEETAPVDPLGHNYVNGVCTRCGASFIDNVTSDSDHPEYGMYFEVDDIKSGYGPELINEYGVLLDYNSDAQLKKVGVYLTQDGTMWRRCIAAVGDNITYATYVPYLSYDEDIKYTGLNSAWINTFRLSENSDGIWCYSNYATIGVNLEDAYGNLLLTLYDIGQAGAKTRIFDDLNEMIEWLKEPSDCISHVKGSMVHDDYNHWYECAVCAGVADAKAPHSYDHNCDADCNVCGATRTVIHDYSPATCTAPATCSVCGDTEGTYLGHRGGEATCKSAAVCEVCSEEYGSIDINNHKTFTVLEYVAPTCTATGLTEGAKCSSCGVVTTEQSVIDMQPHSYAEKIIPATLTKDGSIESKCTVCEDVEFFEVIPRPEAISLSTAVCTYNGKKRTPSVIITDTAGNTLVKNTDYTVTYESGRILPGRYTVKVTFKGNYSGSENLIFTIKPKAPIKLSATQSASVVKLTWQESAGATGYRVYQYSPSKDKYVLKASVKGVTSYRVTNLKAGTEYKFKIKPYTKLSDGTVLWATASKEFLTATECKAPSITSVTSPSKSKATVKWSNVDGETGFQLYYSTKKDSGYKKVVSYEANKLAGSKTFSSSASGKTIYFKVRAYHKVNGQTIFSEWSAVKSVKLK